VQLIPLGGLPRRLPVDLVVRGKHLQRRITIECVSMWKKRRAVARVAYPTRTGLDSEQTATKDLRRTNEKLSVVAIERHMAATTVVPAVVPQASGWGDHH
jgi:hypothetical protein